jgi:hypothetical protein
MIVYHCGAQTRQMLEVHCNYQLYSVFNLHPLMGKPCKPKLTSTHFYAVLPHFSSGRINARILKNKARSKNARITHVDGDLAPGHHRLQ